MTKRNLMLLAAAVAAGGTLLAGVHFAAAAGTSTQSLSDAIAQKLNVNSTDVQNAITSYRSDQQAARQADRRAKYEAKLSQAVTDGKLTADQKTKLLAEYDSVQSKVSDLQKQLQQVRTDAEQWAKDNNIDAQYLPGSPGMHGPGGHGHGPMGM